MDTPGVPLILPIAEGYGEVEALLLLMQRIVYDKLRRSGVKISTAMNAHGKTNLTKPHGVEKYMALARNEGASAVLLLLDADDDTACVLACELQARVAVLNLPFPVAIVCADREYESWFLAGAASLAGRWGLPSDLCPPEAPVRNPKRWLTDNMLDISPYKATTHQVRMTKELDLDVVETGSRSFRRLLHAVEELLDAMDAGECPITPSGCP